MLFSATVLFAQPWVSMADSLKNQVDAKGLIGSLLRNKKHSADTAVVEKRSNWLILPSAQFNQSVGFAAGVVTSGVKTFGNAGTTSLSIINGAAYLSASGLSTFELRHNIYTADNQWNLQGKWEAGKTVAVDNGLGTGSKSQSDGNFTFGNLVFDDNSTAFPISYSYFKFSERVYRKVSAYFYAGAGLSFNMYDNIAEPGTQDITNSHNYRYSLKNKFSPGHYASNGVLFNFEYNSRDQPNRPYKGIFADVVLKANETALGSQHSADQLKVEFRKYWSLSQKNPETVLAFWHWSSFLLNGTLPYLDLPGTGSDAYGRAGRAYVIGRFKGLSFVYDETEFRFPLTENKLLSAVTFVNAETGDNQRNVRLFKFWEPGAGAGLRLLFNKFTRSNICIDYGRGNYGANGLFLGLNEVF